MFSIFSCFFTNKHLLKYHLYYFKIILVIKLRDYVCFNSITSILFNGSIIFVYLGLFIYFFSISYSKFSYFSYFFYLYQLFKILNLFYLTIFEIFLYFTIPIYLFSIYFFILDFSFFKYLYIERQLL